MLNLQGMGFAIMPPTKATKSEPCADWRRVRVSCFYRLLQITVFAHSTATPSFAKMEPSSGPCLGTIVVGMPAVAQITRTSVWRCASPHVSSTPVAPISPALILHRQRQRQPALTLPPWSSSLCSARSTS